MIYKKDANFPYPVLSGRTNSYTENHFELDVNVNENVDYYYITISYEIESAFINNLIRNKKAELILIIQSKDNKFYRLAQGQEMVKIHKSRLSLGNRTSIQLHIQAKEQIPFALNEDLNDFYQQFKQEIQVPKFGLLGYSNVVIFDGSMKKPYDIFEKRLDEHLKSDIKIELGQETIIIHYKKEAYQFNHLSNSKILNNPYIYAGLTKALHTFIVNNSVDGDVDIDEIEEPSGALDLKLYHLMKSKKVTELNFDNVDEVIYSISDRIIEKYTTTLGEMVSHGN
jgi:hypothetical protein